MSTRSSWAIAAAIGNDRQRGSAAAIGNDRQRPSPTIGSQDRQRPSATIAELSRSVTESSRPLSSWRLTQVPSTGENKSRASCPARYSHADMSSEINFHRQRSATAIGNDRQRPSATAIGKDRQRPSSTIGSGHRQRSASWFSPVLGAHVPWTSPWQSSQGSDDSPDEQARQRHHAHVRASCPRLATGCPKRGRGRGGRK